MKYGFTPSFHEYNVLLSTPKPNEPNYVYIVDDNDKELFKSREIEDFLVEEEKQTDVKPLPPFLAYAPKGDVTVKKTLFCLPRSQ